MSGTSLTRLLNQAATRPGRHLAPWPATRPASPPATRSAPAVPARRAVSAVLRRAGTAVGMVAALAALPSVIGDYPTVVLTRTLVLALVATSVALLTGIAGLPTLGQTAPFAVGGYAAALVATNGQPVAVVQLVVAVAAGAGFAALTAPLVGPTRGVVTLMVTLAIGELTVIAAGRWKSVTGGTDGLFGVPAGPAVWGLPTIDTDRGRYLYVLVVGGLGVAALLTVLRSPVGLLLRATRDDPARAMASGHRITGYLAVAYVSAGALAGAAGSLLVTSQQYVAPADFGFEISALLLLAVTLGGATSIPGAVAGTVLVFGTRDWLAGLLPGHRPLLLGLLFLITTYLLPTGLAGAARPALALATRLRRGYRPGWPGRRPSWPGRRSSGPVSGSSEDQVADRRVAR